MASSPALVHVTETRAIACQRKPTQQQLVGSIGPVDLRTYLELGYPAVSHVLIDHWMATMSGTEFKLAVLFLRQTMGDKEKRDSGDLRVGVTLAEMQELTGADREAIVHSVRELERKGLVTAQRAHRKATIHTLILEALLRPWIGKTDSTESSAAPQTESGKPTQGMSRVGKTDSKPADHERRVGIPDLSRAVKVGETDSKHGLGSVKPTLNAPFESGFPTPYKEIKATAAAALFSRGEPPDKTVCLTEDDWAEVRRIEAQTGLQIDGKNALVLKSGADKASLSLAHLRWFLRTEKFAAARNPVAVLLTIAREFPERSQGIAWPENLEGVPVQGRGLSAEEILRL